MTTSDVALARPWPRGSSMPDFYGLGLWIYGLDRGFGLIGPGFVLGLDTCTDIFLVSP